MIDIHTLSNITFTEYSAKEVLRSYEMDSKFRNIIFSVISFSFVANGYTIGLKLGNKKEYIIFINIHHIISKNCSNIMKWFYFVTTIKHEMYHVKIDNNDSDLIWSKELFYVVCDNHRNKLKYFLERINQNKKTDYELSFEEQYCIWRSLTESIELFNPIVNIEEIQEIKNYIESLELYFDTCLTSYGYYDKFQYIYKNYLSNLLYKKKKLLVLINQYPELKLIFNEKGNLRSLIDIWYEREKNVDKDFFDYVLIQTFLCLNQDYKGMFEKSSDLKQYMEKLIISYVNRLLKNINKKEELYRMLSKRIVDYNELLIVNTISNLANLADMYCLNISLPYVKIL